MQLGGEFVAFDAQLFVRVGEAVAFVLKVFLRTSGFRFALAERSVEFAAGICPKLLDERGRFRARPVSGAGRAFCLDASLAFASERLRIFALRGFQRVDAALEFINRTAYVVDR